MYCLTRYDAVLNDHSIVERFRIAQIDDTRNDGTGVGIGIARGSLADTKAINRNVIVVAKCDDIAV